MTRETDPDWAQRHIRLMGVQRGHWCSVEGCTGSQPLMWVPTEHEVWAEKQPRGQAIDMPTRSPLQQFLRRQQPA